MKNSFSLAASLLVSSFVGSHLIVLLKSINLKKLNMLRFKYYVDFMEARKYLEHHNVMR